MFAIANQNASEVSRIKKCRHSLLNSERQRAQMANEVSLNVSEANPNKNGIIPFSLVNEFYVFLPTKNIVWIKIQKFLILMNLMR